MILREKKPQTLLLFSDENMAWLYEDDAFVARWTELFVQVLLRGNRVRMIHTISRDMNEMLEAVTKWVPIYMTGMIEPYCYPRPRNGVFQRTLFIAPSTAAVVSSSVQQDTDQMLNLFITDRAAVEALSLEYEHYFSVCRPLMRVFKAPDADAFCKTVETLSLTEGNACLCCAMPPLFAMPEKLVQSLVEETGNTLLTVLWKKSLSSFRRQIKNQTLSLTLLDPAILGMSQGKLHPPLASLFSVNNLSYSREQYLLHLENLMKQEKKYENLKVNFRTDVSDNMLLYVKDDVGVIMAKTDQPMTAFVINERNMVNVFWDYLAKT